MGLDKFIEKMTIINTAVCTIALVIIVGTFWNALCVLVSIPMTGLAVLAIHEMQSDVYRSLKDTMKQGKLKPYIDWKQLSKETRKKYVSSVVLAIIWNISLYIVTTVYLLIKLGL